MPQLLRLLKHNKISVTPRTLARILFLLQSSFWSSIFSVLEKITYSERIDQTTLPEDPVFIVGHWRTGSTFLHQMLSLDPKLVAPSLFHVAVPESFLVSYKYHRPLFKAVVSKSRPMDNVKLGMDEPQEDEYAIYRLTRFSPLEELVFPKKKEYFLLNLEKYLPNEKQRTQWEEHLAHYVKKFQFKYGKTIVFKNPFNSFRIPLLTKQFPKARFILICRHPYAVVPSTIHMWNIVQQQNCLNNNSHKPSITEVTLVMKKMYQKVQMDFQKLPEHQKMIIRYEELEVQPIVQLQRLYQHLSLPWSGEFQTRLIDFLDEVKDYKKNHFHLSADDKRIISGELSDYMNAHGYSS